MHPTAFDLLKPTSEQIAQLTIVQAAAKAYSDILEAFIPDGDDKAFLLRNHRSNAMWANAAIVRLPDGTPRP